MNKYFFLINFENVLENFWMVASEIFKNDWMVASEIFRNEVDHWNA